MAQTGDRDSLTDSGASMTSHTHTHCCRDSRDTSTKQMAGKRWQSV